jgi:hypothetical protein
VWHWLQDNAVAILLFGILVLYLVRVDKKLALLQRDLDWMLTQLNKWGFPSPEKKE